MRHIYSNLISTPMNILMVHSCILASSDVAAKPREIAPFHPLQKLYSSVTLDADQTIGHNPDRSGWQRRYHRRYVLQRHSSSHLSRGHVLRPPMVRPRVTGQCYCHLPPIEGRSNACKLIVMRRQMHMSLCPRSLNSQIGILSEAAPATCVTEVNQNNGWAHQCHILARMIIIDLILNR
jgi:hypothetical protein